MSGTVHDADQCSRAIKNTLKTMNPPIEVYACILQLIAECACGDDEWRVYDDAHFKVDDRTITRIAKDSYYSSAYGAGTVAFAQRSWRIKIETP